VEAALSGNHHQAKSMLQPITIELQLSIFEALRPIYDVMLPRTCSSAQEAVNCFKAHIHAYIERRTNGKLFKTPLVWPFKINGEISIKSILQEFAGYIGMWL
jgi:hypothetical protein